MHTANYIIQSELNTQDETQSELKTQDVTKRE